MDEVFEKQMNAKEKEFNSTKYKIKELKENKVALEKSWKES